MPELEKLAKVLDNKVKEIAGTGKNSIINKTVAQPSILEILTEEQNDLFFQLGEVVYESEKSNNQSSYKKLVDEIQNKQQMINAEILKRQGKKCQKCGATLSEGAMFCSNCGQKVAEVFPESEKPCPQCGVPIKPGAKFCVKCGERLV